MALIKTCLALFVIAAAFSSHGPEARASAVDSQFGFGLQDLVSYFGIGGKDDDDCEDCVSDDQQGLLEVIQNNKRPKDEFVVPPSKALIKKLLYKLLSKRPNKGFDKIKSKIKNCNKPISLQFLQTIILDCVKDVVRAVNSNSSVIPVDNQVTERSREKVQDLYNKFVERLEKKFVIVKDALDSVKDSKIVEDIKERIEDIITDSKIKTESLIQFFNGTSGKYDDQLKNVRQIINENIKKFTEQILSSKCISLRKSNAAFCKCLEPIYVRFTCNLTNQIEKVDEISKSLQIIGREAIKYVEKNIEKVLQEAKEKAKELLERIGESVQPNTNKEEFLKNKSEEASKLIEAVITGPISDSKNGINIQKENLENVLNKTIEELKNSQQPLIDAINKFPHKTCHAVFNGNSSADIEKYIKEKSNDIKKLVDQTFDKVVNAEKKLADLENGLKSLQEEFSISKVDEKCKKEKPSIFVFCVNNTYNKVKSKLNSIITSIGVVYTPETLKTDFVDILEKTKKILDDVPDVQKEVERLNKKTETVKANDNFINASLKRYEEVINAEIGPLNCKVDSAANGAVSELGQISPAFVRNITDLVASFLEPNQELSENDKQFIQENTEIINNKIDAYKKQISEYQNNAKVADSKFGTIVYSFNEQYLKEKCRRAYCSSQFALNECVNEESLKLNDDLHNIVKELNDAINNIENVKLNASVDLNKEIQNILQKANETYTALALDKNTPDDSSVTISHCIQAINIKANDDVLPKIEATYDIPGKIRDNITAILEAKVPPVQNLIVNTKALLDKAAALNPAKFAKINQDFAQLVSDSEYAISEKVNASLNDLNSLEVKIDEKQFVILSALAALDPNVFNKSCEAEYKSKAKFATCIEQECKKVKDFLTTVENSVKSLEENANGILTNVEEEVTKLIDENLKKIVDDANKANSEAEAFVKEVELNKTKDDYVNRILNETKAKITPELANIFSNSDKFLDNTKTSLNNIPKETEAKLTEIIKSENGGLLTEADKKLIQEAINNITKVVEGYNNVIKNVSNTLNDLAASANETVSTYNKQYLDKQCEATSGDLSDFKDCVNINIKNLQNIPEAVGKDANFILKQVENILADVEFNLKPEIAKIEEALKNTLTNRNAEDKNNATTSAELMAECLDSVSKRVNETLNQIVNEILAFEDDLLKDVKQKANEVNASIKSSYVTEIEALDFAIFLNPKEISKYNTKKAALNASLNETLNKINNIVNQNLNSFTELKAKVIQIKSEVATRLEAFKQNLNKSCEAVYSSKTNYSKCIDAECTKFNNYLTEKETALHDLSNDATILSFNIVDNITSTLQKENTTATENSKKDIEALFKENNVTQQSVINLALSDLARYNVTPYNNNVNLINQRAVELRARQTSMNNTANNMFGRIEIALNLHEYVAHQVCPKVSIKNETTYAANLIKTSRSLVMPYLPNFNDIINEEINISLRYDKLLKDQIAALQPDAIKTSCASVLNDLYKFFQCLKGLVNNFGDVFTKASGEVKLEAQKALEELQNRTVVLNKFRDINVTNEINALTATLGPIPEDIYKGECNATKDKLLDFAQLQIDNRYNRLKPILDNLEKNVSAAADIAAARNYKNIVNIDETLKNTQNFLKDAIAAAQKKNASYVKPPLLQEPDKNIGIGINKFQKFLQEIPLNASIAKANAKELIAKSETLYKNSNKSAVNDACYTENVQRPLSSFIVCNNGYAYNFEVALNGNQAKLEEAAKTLAAVNNADGKKLVQDYANQLAEEAKAAAAYASIKIYIENGIDIPEALKPYMKSNCLVGGSFNANCIITT